MPTPITELTAQDIIKSSLKAIGAKGIGDQLSSDEATECLEILNMMIDEWNLKNTVPFYSLNEVFDLVEGQTVYTIGLDDADFETTRPIKIDSAFLGITSGSTRVDSQIDILDNDSFQRIGIKGIDDGFPRALLYTPTYPNGTITVNGSPQAGHQIGLSQRKQLSTSPALTTQIALPSGYLMAIRYNLAINLAPVYGKEFLPGWIIPSKAAETLGDIMVVNNDPPMMEIDDVSDKTSRTRRSGYNIFEG
jgi:hypothetical protein